MLRLWVTYSLIAVIGMSVWLLPAYQIGQLSLALWLLASGLTASSVGYFTASMAQNSKEFELSKNQAESFLARLVWVTAEGLCVAFVILGFLLAVNAVRWLGLATPISGNSQNPACVFFRHLFVLGQWNVSIAMAFALIFPAKELVTEMSWRVITNHDAM